MSPEWWPAPGCALAWLGLIGMLLCYALRSERAFDACSVLVAVGTLLMIIGLGLAVVVGGLR